MAETTADAGLTTVPPEQVGRLGHAAAGPSSPEPLIMEQLYAFASALRAGDFSARLPTGQPGRMGEATRVLNALADQVAAITAEVTRVSNEIAVQGRLGGWVDVLPQSGQWKQMVDAVNTLACHITGFHRDLAGTLRLVAAGDGSREVTARGCQGEERDLMDAANAARQRLVPVEAAALS